MKSRLTAEPDKESEQSMAVAGSPPWHYSLAKWLIRHGIRGPGLWLRAAHSMGLLNRTVRYKVADDVSLDVPLKRRENQWDAAEISAYEAQLFEVLLPKVKALPTPVTLVDAGADIGIFSVLLASRADISRIAACEPNQEAFAVLSENLARLSAATRALPLALADYSGRGVLKQPAYDPRSAHAAFLQDDPQGEVEVTTIDALGLADGASLVLKIDVEGGELAVVHGAANTLRRAPSAVVAFEAHRQVVERTDVDPSSVVRALMGLRAMEFCVAEAPEQKLHPHRPFFSQYKDRDIYNVVAWG